MTTGIILAGGYSSRAHINKLLLKVDSKPLISYTIDSVRNNVDKVIVVTGHFDKELRPYLEDVEVVFNKDYDLGMFSSVLAGVSHTDGDVLILPGDMADISTATVKAILTKKGKITIPTYNGKHGHPLFLNKEMANLLLKEDKKSNLKEFINKHSDVVNLVEVNDPSIKFDVDTIEDFEQFLSKRKEQAYES